MKGKLFAFVFFMCIGVVVWAGSTRKSQAAEVAVSEKNFPDEIFRNYISDDVDMNHDGVLSSGEIRQTKKLVFEGRGIVNYKGIGYLRELEEIRILDISQEDEDGLEVFNYMRGGVFLDLSDNHKIKKITCEAGSIRGLDLSKLKQLQEIRLHCAKYEEQDITLPDCMPKLETLVLKNVPVPYIDFSACKKLRELELDEVTSLSTTLNVSGCRALRSLRIVGGDYCRWNVRGCVNLQYVSLKGQQGKKLDLRKNHKLEEVECGDNQLEEILLSAKAGYRELWLENNQLKKLDLRKVKVKTVNCKNNKIHSLKAKGNQVIRELYCQNNRLKKLDVRGCKQLKILLFEGNKKLKNRNVRGWKEN